MAETAVQRHMPRRRDGHTTAVTIGAERFYLTANARDDGSLGEVFIQWGKQGTTGAGLMDIYAVALSVGLQHRVPLAELIRQGLDLYFVPNGHTDDPQIPRVRSVADYIARRLAIDWLPTTSAPTSASSPSTNESTKPAAGWVHTIPNPHTQPLQTPGWTRSAGISPPPSVGQVTGWLTRRPDSLDEDETLKLKKILDRSPALSATYQQVNDFADIR